MRECVSKSHVRSCHTLRLARHTTHTALLSRNTCLLTCVAYSHALLAHVRCSLTCVAYSHALLTHVRCSLTCVAYSRALLTYCEVAELLKKEQATAADFLIVGGVVRLETTRRALQP